MIAEQVVLMLLQVVLFTSVLTLGFKTTLSEPFFLISRPRLFIRTFLAMYVVVPVVTALILTLTPLPVGVKIGVILLAISPVAVGSPHNMLALGATPAYVYSLLISMSLIAIVVVPISLTILTAVPLAHDASVPPLLALLVLNLGGIAEVGVFSFIVLFVLTVVSLAPGHSLGGPAFGDRVALAMASAQRQMAIATLIAAINFPGAVTIDVIVIYLLITMLVTIPYTKWCKKQLVAQVKT
jgi:bile acid:Na+ symporter, BASS family